MVGGVRVTGFALGLCAMAGLMGCGASQATVARPHGPPTPHELYPFATDNAWSWDVDAGDGDSVLTVSRVVSMDQSRVEILSGNSERLFYELRPEGIFRPQKGGWLLKGPLSVGASWQSGPGTVARVTSM